MPNRRSSLLRQDLRHLVKAERFRPGRRVRPALVPRAYERGHGRIRDIASIDHGHPPAQRRGRDCAVAHHAEQVLHEERRPQNGEGEAGPLEGSLGLPVLPRHLQRRVVVRAEHRQLDDVANLRSAGRLDDRLLLLDLPVALSGDDEHSVDSCERERKRRHPIEVAHDLLDLPAQPLACLVGIAHEGTRSLSHRDQPPDDMRADLPGRSHNEDHAKPSCCVRARRNPSC
jgi:hypothetical protein